MAAAIVADGGGDGGDGGGDGAQHERKQSTAKHHSIDIVHMSESRAPQSCSITALTLYMLH